MQRAELGFSLLLRRCLLDTEENWGYSVGNEKALKHCTQFSQILSSLNTELGNTVRWRLIVFVLKHFI